jgi:hypothetical protein
MKMSSRQIKKKCLGRVKGTKATYYKLTIKMNLKKLAIQGLSPKSRDPNQEIKTWDLGSIQKRAAKAVIMKQKTSEGSAIRPSKKIERRADS